MRDRLEPLVLKVILVLMVFRDKMELTVPQELMAPRDWMDNPVSLESRDLREPRERLELREP